LKPQEAGGEPDECYCLRENKEWPDLVVEVALTSGGFSKRSFCATFPIPELWIWRNDSLEVHDFDPATAAYHSLPESRQLPGIDLNWLVECSRIEATSQGIKTFRSRL
jgi:Uma2 family endonuclease